jgi:hypothetical protein
MDSFLGGGGFAGTSKECFVIENAETNVSTSLKSIKDSSTSISFTIRNMSYEVMCSNIDKILERKTLPQLIEYIIRKYIDGNRKISFSKEDKEFFENITDIDLMKKMCYYLNEIMMHFDKEPIVTSDGQKATYQMAKYNYDCYIMETKK